MKDPGRLMVLADKVRCWELRQQNVIHRASRPSRPDKARRLGYKAKQGALPPRLNPRSNSHTDADWHTGTCAIAPN